MQFLTPDPNRYRISECGNYIIEKFQTKTGAFYGVWEYKQVLYGCKSPQECVDAIKNREAGHLKAEADFFRYDSSSSADPVSAPESSPTSEAS